MVWKSGESGEKHGKARKSGEKQGEMIIHNGTDGMQVPNSTYKAQHKILLGKLFQNCLMVYGGTTPLKQKETHALCVPSFMFSCLSDCTLFKMENERSTSQDVCMWNGKNLTGTLIHMGQLFLHGFPP